MNVVQVKKKLLDKGLSISEMARELQKNSDAQFHSIRTALTELLYGKRFHPTLAKEVADKFGITIERPIHQESVRQKIKLNRAA